MDYHQISITAFIKHEKILYIWLHEFENNPQINENWEIENVKLVYHLRRMDFEIKHKNGKQKALVFVNFLVSDKKKTMLSETLKEKLEEIERR